MAPDIPKIDPDRHLDLGTAAWCFRYEVLRLLLHSHSLSLSRVTVLIPFFGNFLRQDGPRAGKLPQTPFFREVHCAVLAGNLPLSPFSGLLEGIGHEAFAGQLGQWRVPCQNSFRCFRTET
jgi:hypothetical protein